MRNHKHFFIIIAGILFAIIMVAGYRWSNQHVSYITAGQPHPLGCVSCHVYTQRSGLAARLFNQNYLSPLNMAISQDGSRLYVTAQEGDALLVVDPTDGQVLSKIEVGKRPHSIILSQDGKIGYVSNQWSNTVSVVNLEEDSLVSTLAVGSGPSGLALDPEDAFLYVANSYSNDITIVDLERGLEHKRLTAGRNPCSVQFSPDGKTVYVTHQLSNPVPFRTPPISEIMVIDAGSQKVIERKNFISAHIMENIAFTPTGDLALVTLVRPKNLVPSTQIERGWMINHGIGIIERGNKERLVQLLLDEPNAFYADPFDVVIDPDRQRAFVTHSGADIVSVININEIRTLLSGATSETLATYANDLGLSSRFVIKRIATGPNPKGLVLSPDGKRLYVAERLADKILVIDAENLEILKTLDLGGPHKTTAVRLGAQLFNNAGHTFHQQYSCYTCHPDGHEDGLIYDLTGTGRNLVNVQTLRDLEGTSPFRWNGKNVSIYMQCGIRFSKFVTRTESFAPANLDALVAYIMRDLSHPPNHFRNASGGELTPTQLRGKAIYERTKTNQGLFIHQKDRCVTCHPPPYFTNRQKADVGTLAATDNPTLFDSPKLSNIYESAPYLHDGRAATLEEIWTKYNPEDKHGMANDLSKQQLNDLIEYLKSL